MPMLDLPALWRPETHQTLFRLILDATARPGTVADLSAHLGDGTAALAVLASFCDNTQSLADLTGTVDATARNFLDTPTAIADQAAFVLADGAAAPGFTPRLGTLDLPDGGATIVLQVAHLGAGQALRLSGPGIKDITTLHVSGLHAGWLTARAQWCANFPLGCDMVLADATTIAVLPRTTQIKEA